MATLQGLLEQGLLEQEPRELAQFEELPELEPQELVQFEGPPLLFQKRAHPLLALLLLFPVA
jgi:hypothetical protein